MKCPNCSFNNPESAEICKVCGFDLSSQEAAPPKREKKSHFKETDDSELDSALKTLFGSDESHEALDEEEVYEINLEESLEEEDYPVKKPPFWILGVVAGLALIGFILFKVFWGSEPAPVDTVPTNVTETPIIVPKDRTAEDQVNQFFTLLPTFVNHGNIAILNLFQETDSSLDSLMAYSESGSIEAIDGFTLTPMEESGQRTLYHVETQIERKSGETISTEYFKWEFELEKIDDQWLITNFSGLVKPDPSQVTDPTEGASEPETTSPPTSAPQTAPPTQEPTTETAAERPDGFISSGTFTGGSITDGQDIYSVRYGLHETFERLVFDIYGWTGSEPTETVPQIGVYEAVVSNDGKLLTITVEGARGAFASRTETDFPNIQSIEYFYPGSDSAVGIRITLAGQGAFKVFELKEPARLIVDYYVGE